LWTKTAPVGKINRSKISWYAEQTQKLYCACPCAYITGSFSRWSPRIVEELVHFDFYFKQICHETENGRQWECICEQN
jgi:hypothetical protein